MVETEVAGAFTGALPTDHNQYGVTQNDGILQVCFCHLLSMSGIVWVCSLCCTNSIVISVVDRLRVA